ncbi:hypothetical protein LJR220_004006 [Bradyrhizobium sp. LjRoot220]|uniref:hypothetical protein n=1 Tax=Bradyrhizobium sp. LjRoot220 TaxID=3342284 RepID=UPI003ECE21FE
MLKSIPALLALAFACLLASPAHADDADRTLLATFCDAQDIEGSTCKRARNYPDAGSRACDVRLTSDRRGGRFIAAGNPLLVVNYESGCEPRATDNGGAVVFEQSDGKTIFRSFQPGSQVNDCITLARSAGQDWLVCITGHIGQGHLETGVAEFVFTQDDSRNVSISPDFLLTATDSIRAYGANVVTCKERSKYFEVSNIKAGPRPQTVSVTVSYADAETITKACRKGFPKPKEVFGRLSRGEAYVPEGYEKRGNFIVDLVTRKVAPQG